MVSRLSLAILVACLVAAPDLVVAQVAGGDVTLKVPLNLTKLSTGHHESQGLSADCKARRSER
jgi:hypothetical protein